MGKNIALLYMSAYFAQPAPEGSKNRFLRTQTNEAAVSALWKQIIHLQFLNRTNNF